MLLEELEIPVKTIDSAFKAGIAGIAGIVAGFTAGAVLAFKATEKWAMELDGIQDVIGGTAKEAAAFNFVLRKSGVDTGTFTKSVVILSKGLVTADGQLDTTGKALKSWGINVKDANGDLKDSNALIEEASKKYNELGTQQERVNFLTEVFGKGGAEMIDFFDTLAAEGGIDAVTAKVERFGLAIDPGRYEQFNRNLEELKLIGLGLAVGFTEKVMPALEGFLGLISDPNLTVKSFATKADEFIGGLIDDIATSVDTWISGGGPEELSTKIISWIENLGDGEGAKSKILAGAQHLLDAVVGAIREINWIAIATALDEEIAEKIGEINWVSSGEAFREGFLEIWNGSWDANMLAGASPIEGTATGLAISGAVQDFLSGVFGQESISRIATWSFDANAIVRTWSYDADAIFANWAAGIVSKVQNWASSVVFSMQNWASSMQSSINTAMSGLFTTIHNKLTDIAKEFYNRAQGWVNQAAQGFADSKGRLLAEVGTIVGAVNAILKKIMTSFSITIHMPDLSDLLGIGGARTDSRTPSSGGRTRSSIQPRASGGPVIAGQNYRVNELGQEFFTPNTGGRIDPMGNITARIDREDLREIIYGVSTLIVGEMQKVRS